MLRGFCAAESPLLGWRSARAAAPRRAAMAQSTSGSSSNPGAASHSHGAVGTLRADEVSGEVTLTQSGRIARPDASQVVVWLSPSGSTTMPHTAIDRPRYRLVQRNKRFEPGLLVVPVGSVVDFPNADPWFHNVFSLYRGKRFDLGLYQAGAQRSVRFDRIGPSYLFCNIHPEMTGVVLAVDSSLYAISDKSGRYIDQRRGAGQIHDACVVRECEARVPGELATNGDSSMTRSARCQRFLSP